MLELLLTLIRRHILITLLLPLAVALTGAAALHRSDIDPSFAVKKVAALMHTTSNGTGGGQVQSFGQIAAGLATTIRIVTP